LQTNEAHFAEAPVIQHFASTSPTFLNLLAFSLSNYFHHWRVSLSESRSFFEFSKGLLPFLSAAASAHQPVDVADRVLEQVEGLIFLYGLSVQWWASAAQCQRWIPAD